MGSVPTARSAGQNPRDKSFRSWFRSWIGPNAETAIAGAVAGLVAETVVHPFDTVSHRSKVHPSSAYGTFTGSFKLIYQQEGIRGFFAGLSATIVQAPPSTAVYFLTYETAKHTGLWLTNGQHENLVFFCAGASSELLASVVFVPLEVAKSRLQLGANPHRATGGVLQSPTNFPGIYSALHGVYRERGMAGLTAGWKSGLVQDMVFSATQFLAYERMKAAFEKSAGGRPANTRETLLSGCVAGGLAAAVTNPLDVVTSRLMVQDGRTGYGRGMAGVWTATVAEGPAALWRGTLPRVAQTAPLSAISFAVYEGIRRWFASDETRRSEYAELVGSANPFTGNS